MDTVRWGLLSTANINRRVIPAIRASERGELVAVASRNAGRSAEYAAEWDIPQSFGSYEDMLESDAVDAVYISLPNHLHAEWSSYALRHGKHVLCEKPFALTLAEVDAMTTAATESGNVLAEAFMYRHHPQTKFVGEWVRDGRLGDLTTIRGVFSFRMNSDENVRLVPEWGGGSLWDIGVYPLSYAQYLAGGPPEWVMGTQWIGSSGVDMMFNGLMQYANGVTAEISSSFRTPFYTHVDVLGTEGHLELNRPFTGLDEEGAELVFVDRDGNTQVLDVERPMLYLGEVEDMHAAILDGAESYVSLEETRNHIRTVLALYESARRGEPVYVEEISYR
ncbi:MAG: Gfo/Idh/MocA family oxidoreductase [Chloroflexota bacterium]